MIDRVIRDGRNPIHAHASASIMFAQFSIQERDEFSRSLKALRHRRSFLLEGLADAGSRMWGVRFTPESGHA